MTTTLGWILLASGLAFWAGTILGVLVGRDRPGEPEPEQLWIVVNGCRFASLEMALQADAWYERHGIPVEMGVETTNINEV